MSLNQDFMGALVDGHLATLRSVVKADETLSGQIGRNRFRVYYRGGLILGIENKRDGYIAEFANQQYAQNNAFADKPGWDAMIQAAQRITGLLNNEHAVAERIALLPSVKHLMDGWFSRNGGEERAFVQQIDFENNRDFAVGSDYFVCDTEVVQQWNDYQPRAAKFDFVGVHWPSNSQERRRPNNRRLVLGEAKYGDGAVAGDHGVVDHWNMVREFAGIVANVDELKAHMQVKFNQRRTLGLIENQNSIEGWSDERPIWLLVLANHDPESSRLRVALSELVTALQQQPETPVEPKVACSNFFGGALFDQAIHGIGEFIRLTGARL